MARNGLKLIGAIENSARGVWSVTEAGRRFSSADEVLSTVKNWRAEYNRQYLARKRPKRALRTDSDLDDDQLDDDLDATIEPTWHDVVLDRLLQMSPAAFERLAQRLLREADFRDVEVLGKSGDGGIDGVGNLRISLVSFPVYFQCKRYKDAVGSSAVRDSGER